MNETDSMLDQLGGVESSVPPLPGCYRRMSRKKPKRSGGSDQNKAIARWDNEGVEDAKRMWKVYATIRRDVVSCRDPPSCTREVTETIDRNYGRLIKWADVECRGEVREMMFNWMDRRADSFAGERLLKKCGDPRPRTPITQPSEH